MRKKLYDEFVAECESSCMDMYIAWLEERIFALDTKVKKFTADNTTKVETVTRKQCHAYTERSCGGKCVSCNEWY